MYRRLKIIIGNNKNKYLSTTSNGDLPGGISKENFIFLTEKLSPFMKSTFDLNVTTIKKGYLEFTVPFRKTLIGNPLTTGIIIIIFIIINIIYIINSITWRCCCYNT